VEYDVGVVDEAMESELVGFQIVNDPDVDEGQDEDGPLSPRAAPGKGLERAAIARRVQRGDMAARA
jgi:hypothetical protein